MEVKLIKGLQAEFVAAAYPGENTSGLIVYGKNVLVRMDECATSTGGGVMLTDEMRDKMSEGAETGCIFLIGPEAFRLFDDGSRWTGDTPQVGDRVYVEKYSGLLARGRDGHIYRIMDYRNIAAGLDADVQDEAAAA